MAELLKPVLEANLATKSNLGGATPEAIAAIRLLMLTGGSEWVIPGRIAAAVCRISGESAPI